MVSEERRQPQGRSLARYIPAAILILVVLWFALANSQRVPIDFIFAERDARLIYIILGSALLGLVAGFLLGRRRYRD